MSWRSVLSPGTIKVSKGGGYIILRVQVCVCVSVCLSVCLYGLDVCDKSVVAIIFIQRRKCVVNDDDENKHSINIEGNIIYHLMLTSVVTTKATAARGTTRRIVVMVVVVGPLGSFFDFLLFSSMLSLASHIFVTFRLDILASSFVDLKNMMMMMMRAGV